MKTLVGICIAIFGIFSGISKLQTQALKYSRATGRLTLELLVVADYSEFNKWYQLTSPTKTVAERTTQAKNDVKKYVGALIHSSNNVYRSLEAHNIFISIKLVDVLVMTTVSDSPWTETVKVAAGTSYNVDPTKVLPIFQPKSTDLQRSIPHDHAMILTKYSLYHGGGGTFSGYAYLEAECKPISVSIVEDNEDFYTAQLIAHEIGHSLGCEHDGNGNSCSSSDGYAMEASFILANKKKWTFSSCSVNYIQNYLRDLQTKHINCLEQINNTHPNSQVETLTHQWYGQVYDLDEQCRIHYGPQSHLCRDQYNGNYTGVCLKMFCHDPVKNACFYLDGGDGTPCGTGKWCMSNECVNTNVSHIQTVDENCAAGDHPGPWFHGLTCQDIGLHHTRECGRSDVRTKCCYTCNHLPTGHAISPTDIDGQCAARHGTGSYMCRGATAYDGKSYADTVCWDLQCHDPNRDNWCLSTEADNNTSCGNHKWCQNKVCVQDAKAPAVPDNCPWGDQKGVASYGLTCDQIKLPEHNWRCYDSFTSKVCCAACNFVRRSVQGCEFGDKSDWCQTHIRSSGDRQTCYFGHNSDLCCESCNKFKNSAHVGCEYGDKINTCVSTKCNTYDAATRAKCCETCLAAPIIG